MEQEILDHLNKLIREEHGNRLAIDSKFIDSEVDSFGTTVVFLGMDEKYECFNNEWFFSTQFKDEFNENGELVKNGITVKEIIERVINESPRL